MKYKVGDKVRIKSKEWYDTNKDEYGNVHFNGEYSWMFTERDSRFCGKVVTILYKGNTSYAITEDNCKGFWTDDMIECKVEEENTLKTQSDNMETETHKGYCTTDVETTNESKKVAWFTFWDNDFADKVELDLSNRELIQEDGKWFVVKKKKAYPKTYEECAKVLGTTLIHKVGDIGYKITLLHKLEHLLIARDAYWKIAGEEMGLGKPWKPDWNDGKWKWCMSYSGNYIEFDQYKSKHHTLAFPTAEMRDAFYENFKSEIEICKELL